MHNSIIPECDVQRHLGVVRSVHPSSVLRTVEHCSAGRSTFFALNTVGSRFGCLHPTTSYRLYSSLCIPILLYGCELWCLTGCEITMLERVHSRTIQGLPLRCHSKALQSLMGAPSILSLIRQWQLNFIHSFSRLPLDSLPHLVLEKRLSSSPQKGILPVFLSLLESLSLPSLPDILNGNWSKSAWRKWVKGLILSAEYSSFLDECVHLPL